ncbi:uncharacterized protein LOC129284431 isoform X2 [Prosopis cineraria]|uniref:uncharacterized protein LOC129284431 isoform X2 n=1 Tax=Prosopis cineraria TaxID=364024 RepID=UPI00240F08E1|nr:uncharacterized protein LOC129284431 isoform X2 [Prosopis cineraria]
MAANRNFNDIVAEPLTESSQKDWFKWVENYLISLDLWGVTSGDEKPTGNRGEDFARWQRKNAAALHVIQISCGTNNHSLIRRIKKANTAWNTLRRAYNPQDPPPKGKGRNKLVNSKGPSKGKQPSSQDETQEEAQSDAEETEQEDGEVDDCYKAISEDNWPAVKAFTDRHRRDWKVKFAPRGETPLHVAAKFGHLDIVKELVELAEPDDLVIHDASGYTPLAIAASHCGLLSIAKCLVSKNEKVLETSNKYHKWIFPVTLAFRCGFNKMGRYLYCKTPLEVFKGEKGIMGASFLRLCFITGNLDIALHLLQRSPELLFAADIKKRSTIQQIACYLSHSPNKSQIWFWKRCVYHCIKIPPTTATEHVSVDIEQESEMSNEVEGMEGIRNMKLQHTLTDEILKLVCGNLKSLNKDKKGMIAEALLTAGEVGNVGFLHEVLKAKPELISKVVFHQKNGQVFFNAVKYRQAEVFNLLCGFRFRDVVATMPSGPMNNNLLHMAAILAPSSQLNRISGAALQMQWELQWFKAVEKVVEPRLWLHPNKEGLNPLDYFKENHKELRKEGEEWMKETATSCSVVGALIITMMFATAFTVPGGNDGTSGYPIFLNKNLFRVFLISDAVSLFASTTSVLTFLGVLTSRYAEEDFLYSLPTKLVIGLSSLFLSIVTMLVAFSATIIMMLQHASSHSWAYLLVIMFASVPVILFVFLQFPLLIEIISSTYGPGIFKRKGKKWP